MSRTAAGGRGLRLRNVPVPEAHLGLLAVAAVLERHRRLTLAGRALRPLGVVLGLLGVGLAAASTRAAGDIDLSQPSWVVRAGPYRYSRHPMYVGWCLVYAGAVLGTRSTWGVVLTPALGALVGMEARAEERTMLARFPDEYASYRARVPRFVGGRRG